tara:strand:- start:509 stop:817 length:309 start_codon:yes stop_codon:yes gene_type:complete
MFFKKNKFLRLLQYQHEFHQESIVKGRFLESELKINYKKVHEIATFWEKKGCVVSRSERGGNLEYQITSLGLLIYEKVNKQENMIKLILLMILFAVIAYFFI